jgi:hypothetical protein
MRAGAAVEDPALAGEAVASAERVLDYGRPRWTYNLATGFIILLVVIDLATAHVWVLGGLCLVFFGGGWLFVQWARPRYERCADANRALMEE